MNFISNIFDDILTKKLHSDSVLGKYDEIIKYIDKINFSKYKYVHFEKEFYKLLNEEKINKLLKNDFIIDIKFLSHFIKHSDFFKNQKFQAKHIFDFFPKDGSHKSKIFRINNVRITSTYRKYNEQVFQTIIPFFDFSEINEIINHFCYYIFRKEINDIIKYVEKNKIKINLTTNIIRYIDDSLLEEIIKNELYDNVDFYECGNLLNMYLIGKFKILSKYFYNKELISLCLIDNDCMKYYYSNLNLTITNDEFIIAIAKFDCSHFNTITLTLSTFYHDIKWFSFENVIKLIDLASEKYASHFFLERLHKLNLFSNFDDLQKNIFIQKILKTKEVFFANELINKWQNINETHIFNLMENKFVSKTIKNSLIITYINMLGNFNYFTELYIISLKNKNDLFCKILDQTYFDVLNYHHIKDFKDNKFNLTEISIHNQSIFSYTEKIKQN